MTKPLTPAVSGDEIVIAMDESSPGKLGVSAVEMSVSSVRVRFSAIAPCPPDDVFLPTVASMVSSICDGIADIEGAVDRPDFCLNVNGLTLQGYTLSVSPGDSGRRRFRLHIRKAVGNVLAMFRVSSRSNAGLALFTPCILSGPTDQLSSQKLFEEMLSQLYLPLINLNAYLRQVFDGSVRERGDALSNSVVQLKTRAETLQFAFDRLIAEMMVEKYAGQRNRPSLESDAA